jgi:ribosome-binding protein aMBF1 (putative translation factor)
MQRPKQTKTFGQRIREAREKKGLSPLQVATELDCSVSMVRMIESDQVRPSKPSVADRMADYLGVPL